MLPVAELIVPLKVVIELVLEVILVSNPLIVLEFTPPIEFTVANPVTLLLPSNDPLI
jgi:hypothetical protein